MNTPAKFFTVCFLVIASFAATANAQNAPKLLERGTQVWISGGFGLAMAISGPDYFYNYNDYAPPGLGLRYGMTGEARLKVTNFIRTAQNLSLVTGIKYTNIFHTSDYSTSSNFSANAVFGMLSFGIGFEQAINMGRTLPYFGLTLDFNESAPGSVTVTTRDTAGNNHSVTKNLSGDIWQLRFGVTPRLGFMVKLARNLSFDASVSYQVINLINRADQTPKNFLTDQYGKEPLLSQMNLLFGINWALPTRTK
ncbi:MAG TPA: hypothetical protein VFJ29_01295 [Candidatus Kapabacteria bacterium]|nr:hypothetical protein [Candidatus Kapabacteria bacterium]